jgi:hypothetical protein
MPHDPPSVEQTSPHVFHFEPRIAFENCLEGVPGREHPQNMLHRQPPPTNNRFTAEDPRVDCDSFEKFVLVHRVTSWPV